MGRKKKERNSRAKIGEEEDRISSLPEDLIHDILSRIEITEAVQTSVLSKRWNRIWATLPNLNFIAHDTAFDRKAFDFQHFVSEFISNRNDDVDVFTVRLNSDDDLKSSMVEKVINYAICHNVKELIIRCAAFNQEKFPPYFFNNASLKILRLILYGNSTDISWSCKSPQSPWNLHCLTVLHLERFLFPEDLYWSLPVLTTLHLAICSVPLVSWSLPALTTLYLEDVTFIGDKCWSFEDFIHLKNLNLGIGRLWSTARMTFRITNLNLTNLIISTSKYYDGPLGLNCTFVVSAPNLTFLEFHGDPSLLLSSEDGFPCLEIVNIDMIRNIDGFPLTNALPPCIFSSPTLKKLRLNISYICKFEPSSRMLQSLTSLHLSNSTLSDLPLSFPVLTKLHLMYCEIPLMSWSLPALETLLLDRVKFLGDKSFSFEDFVHLKNLTLEMLLDMWNGREVFSISSLSLTNLTISEFPYERTLKCKFLVSAPNLSCLEYSSSFPRLLSAEDGFPNLEKINIDINFGTYLWRKYCEEKKQVVFQQLISMFHQIRRAKFLKLSFSTIMVLSRIPDFSEYQLSPFGNLKCLKLYRTQGPESPTNSPIRVINYLLNKSPGAMILIQDTVGFINYNPEVNMLRWTGSCYSVMEPEDSSSDDDNISSSNENHVSREMDYSGEVAEHKRVHADEKHAKVQGGHTKDGGDETIVQAADEERMEEDHVKQDPELKVDVVQQEAITEVTKWIPGQVNAMSNIHVNSNAIRWVQGGVNDQALSYSRKSSLSLWEGHQVCSEFVDLLHHIKEKHPETFEHFAPQTEMVYTLGLNTLCTSVSAFYEVSTTNFTTSIITHYRGLFADLERWGFNTNWLVNHLNNADEQYCSIDHRIDNAQREVQELQSRLDNAQKEVKVLQALLVAKTSDQMQ